MSLDPPQQAVVKGPQVDGALEATEAALDSRQVLEAQAGRREGAGLGRLRRSQTAYVTDWRPAPPKRSSFDTQTCSPTTKAKASTR